MTTAFDPMRAPVIRRLAAGVFGVMVVLAVAGPATAHGPDPTLSGFFGPNQDLRYRWRSGSEPTSAVKAAIQSAAADANASRGSKAATFTYDSNGANPIGYGAGATCGVNGLACFTRNAPSGFTMWFREQGHVFDWGTLKWCQSYSSPPNGCYDARTIALDEFGHVEGLGHHVNYADNSDYNDAVVQTYSRTKPQSGYNIHAFQRCDVATLQLEYDMVNTSAKYSTCLHLSTVLSLAPSTSTIAPGGTAALTATLKVGSSSAYVQLVGNPVSGRTVTLQRRTVGATSWTTVGSMGSGAAAGTYLASQSPSVDTEYRAVFATPSGDGLVGDTSPTVRVLIGTSCAAAPARNTPAVPCI
jgi:hypothetical protein